MQSYPGMEGIIAVEKIRPASWESRFWAWLIDVLLVSVLWYPAATALSIYHLSLTGLAYHGALMFLYWTALEGYRGQSLGKMILNQAVVGPAGEGIGFKDAALESFGKAFLLPVDCLAGWLARPGCGQRICNLLSNTMVADVEDVGVCTV